MKTAISFAVAFLIVSISTAQNVGIGTTSPGAKLHVSTTNSVPLRLDGGDQLYVPIYEGGAYRGYFGSYSGSAEDIDFGTGAGTNGKLHLVIKGTPALTITNSRMVGIGTTAPTEMLDIQSGNIIMNNSDKGIILNNADKPFITRGFDAFTSGANAGLGRWGIFMEPSRLTFGIPNIVGKAFEFASYEDNSSRNPVLTIDRLGGMKRPATNNVDLLPVCMGTIRWNNGSLTYPPVINGTGNFTISPYVDGGFVEITITGHYYTTGNYLTQVTCIRDDAYGSSTGRAVVKDSGNGKLQVFTYINENTQYSRSFSFVVYKMN